MYSKLFEICYYQVTVVPLEEWVTTAWSTVNRSFRVTPLSAHAADFPRRCETIKKISKIKSGR